MDNKDAIKTLEHFLSDRPDVETLDPDMYAGYLLLVSATKTAIDALNKQIAKPPTQIEDEDELCVRYECPACGGFLMQLEARRMKSARRTPMRWPRFCECGQRINWEVTK